MNPTKPRNIKTLLMLILLIFFIASPVLVAQVFNVYSVNTDNWPTVRAFFNAKNQVGQDYQNLQINEFEVLENGRNMQSTLELRCDEVDFVPPVSVVLVIDASPSMDEPGLGSSRKFDWVEIAARAFVDSINYTPRTAVAITSFAGDVVDWTGRVSGTSVFKNNKADLHTYLDNLRTWAGRTLFNPAFLKPGLGAIDLLKSRPEDVRRVIVFLTDGQPDDDFDKYQQVIDQCLEARIQMYAITIDANMFSDLGYAAERTGGNEWEITDKNQLTSIYSQIAEEIQRRDICRLEWTAPYGCDEASRERDLKVTFRRISKSDEVTYTAPESSIAEISLNNDEFYFGAPGGGVQTHDIILTAEGSDFDVSGFSITPNNGAFQLSENPPYSIAKGQSKTIQITYTEDPPSESTEYTLQFSSSPCSTPPISLIAPCGGHAVDKVSILNVPIGNPEEFDIDCAFENTTATEISGNAQITGPDATRFAFVSGGGPFTLAPGGCLDLRLRFSPNDEKMKIAQIDYNIPSDCGQPFTELNGKGMLTDFPLAEMNWGDRRIYTENDSTYVVTNQSNATVNILSVYWKFANDDNFTAQLPMVETSLAPGETLDIPVSFVPQSEGIKENYLVFNIEGFNDEPEARLAGNGYNPALEVDDLTFADTRTGQTDDGSLPLRNLSQFGPLYIYEMNIIENNSEFAFGAQVDTDDLVVPADAQIQMEIIFSPQNAGLRTGRLEIVHDGAPGPEKAPTVRDTILLSGNGLALMLTPDTLNFGQESLCAYAQSELKFTNNSSAQMRILSITITGADRADFEASAVNPIIEPGEEGSILVIFTPSHQGMHEASLRMETDQGDAFAKFYGMGLVYAYAGQFEKDYIKSQPGQNLDVAFTSPIPDAGAPVEYIKYIMTYDPNILKFDSDKGFSGPTDWTWEADQTAPGTLEITGSGVSIPTPVSLAHSVPFKTYLADDSATTVTLATEFAADYNCLIDQPDEVTIDLQTCATQNRLITVNTTKYSLAAPYPNPGTGRVTLDYSVGLNAHTSITIYNSMGERAAEVVNSTLDEGKYQSRIDVSQLGSGVYYIRMQSGPYAETRRLLIAK